MSTRKRTMKSLNQKVLYSLLEKKRTQINTQIPQQREKNVWQSSKWCLFRYACSAFDTQRARDRQRMGDRQRERERDREGVERREWRVQKKKKRENQINVGRARSTAGKPDRSFFFSPFSSPTLSLSSSPCSFPIHCLRVCQREAEPTYLAPGARSLSQYVRLKG